MKLHILDTPECLGEKAAQKTAVLLREAIAEKGSARLILSTGASQFETISHLRKQAVDWTKVELFHLDEYIGVGQTHPASFVKYLRERFIQDDIMLKNAYFFDGNREPSESIREMTAHIRSAPVDVALIGIEENAHVAFNDPPADFETREAFTIVTLDDACKRQQVREKWFETVDDVPKIALSMTVYQIMQSRSIVSAVPHIQKAEAVKKTLENEPTEHIPSTMLKTHADWTLYLDKASASLLRTDDKLVTGVDHYR